MPFPFAGSVALLEGLLARRGAGVERIENRLLNVKGKDAARRRDRQYFDSALDACVFADLPREAAALRGQLASAHLADGFEVMFRDAYAHRLDPAALVVRAYEHWEAHRWPGASARLVYAATVYSALLFRLLEDLSLRIWDPPDHEAPRRLQDIQRLLDGLNGAHPGTGLVRDAHWLVQTAQGPITRQLAPYFRVAARIAASFPGDAGIALHAAGAKLAGGHLRSQLRQRASELDRPPDDPDVLVTTRNSNAMDMALLVWDLVALLESYLAAGRANDRPARRRLADAILQGCSADPDLLLTRLDLLAPCTAIETVFIRTGEPGRVALTAAGTRHATMLARYAELVDEAAPALVEDAAALDPASAAYSPFALVYGFCADLLSMLAVDTLYGTATQITTLEDLFASGGSEDLRTRVEGWRIDYSPTWGREIFAPLVAALERRRTHAGRANASGTGSASLLVFSGDAPDGLPARAQDFCVTTDVGLALATGATAFPRSQFMSDRHEGRYLASAETGGHWFGVSKAVMTARIARGQDAVMTGVPQNVIDVLRLTCEGICRV